MKKITVDDRYENMRFNKFIRHLLPSAGMGFIYRMLRKKNIVLNGKKADGSEQVHAGDEVKIFFSDETYADLSEKKPRDINRPKPVKVLYEDDDIIAVHKPRGLKSQSDRAGGDCVNARILSLLESEGKLPDDYTPSIVNRLDTNTTGIILAGKTYRGTRRLTEQIREGQIVKTYKCICRGDFKERIFVKNYIVNEKKDQVRVSDTRINGGKIAKTEFIPERKLNGYTLLSVILYTGRKHQIRATLAHLGYPVAGDSKYGNERGYMYLHSYSVSIPDIGVIYDRVPTEFERFINAHL